METFALAGHGTRNGVLTSVPPFPMRLESCPWMEVGQPVDSDSARAYLLTARELARPKAVYIHVPFCSAICSYCALYTRAVPAERTTVFDEYLDLVGRSLADHPLRARIASPTTVHFGGGTPLHLGIRRLTRLISLVREAFGDSPVCEWALETNTSSITPETTAVLTSVGMHRLHLGIQTLDDGIRKQVRRREDGARALRKVEQLGEAGFHVSVDLIIGLDGYDRSVLLGDLHRLYAAGVRMFSICELRHRRPQGTRADREEHRNRQYWDVIWDFMTDHGLSPIHLGQFGRDFRDNLYYTHPARDEDCVAIGPYANGSCGSLYYANLLLPEYYRAVRAGQIPIGHAVVYEEDIQTVRRLESQLLAHRVDQSALDAAAIRFPTRLPGVFEYWLERCLLLRRDGDGPLMLSRDGSWFVGNMIRQLRAAVMSIDQREDSTEATWTTARPYSSSR